MGSLCQLFASTPFILHYILSMLYVLSTKNIAQKILLSIAHCVKTANTGHSVGCEPQH
jgi:hypothetical protein